MQPGQLILAGLAWATLWVNVAVLPFYKKRESLYKDYESSGEIDAALSAVESKKLIPALARMFDGIMDRREDKRRAYNFADLLQLVDFLPDFRGAEEAYREMSELKFSYEKLKKCSDLWRWALAHAILSALIPISQLDLSKVIDWQWIVAQYIVPVLAVLWLVTLCVMVWYLIRFKSLMNGFLEKLASTKG